MAAGVPAAGARKRPPSLSPETIQRIVALTQRMLAAKTKRVVIAARVGLNLSALNKLIRDHALASEPTPAPAAPPEPTPAVVEIPPAPPAPLPVVVEAPPLDPEAAHLVCFTLPPLPAPLPAEARASQAWLECAYRADRLEDLAAAHSGRVRAGLLHLADLRRNHLTFYPGRQAASAALPTPFFPVPQSRLIGSSAQACSEA